MSRLPTLRHLARDSGLTLFSPLLSVVTGTLSRYTSIFSSSEKTWWSREDIDKRAGNKLPAFKFCQFYSNYKQPIFWRSLMCLCLSSTGTSTDHHFIFTTIAIAPNKHDWTSEGKLKDTVQLNVNVSCNM